MTEIIKAQIIPKIANTISHFSELKLNALRKITVSTHSLRTLKATNKERYHN